MKAILAAGIVRTLRFDYEYEADYYLKLLAWREIPHKINWREDLPNGVVIMSVTTAYNNTPLIERIKEIAEEGENNGEE